MMNILGTYGRYSTNPFEHPFPIVLACFGLGIFLVDRKNLFSETIREIIIVALCPVALIFCTLFVTEENLEFWRILNLYKRSKSSLASHYLANYAALTMSLVIVSRGLRSGHMPVRILALTEMIVMILALILEFFAVNRLSEVYSS